jgi:uncharacterized hydantoinase/oxoprolinase family protein
MYQKR